MLYAYTSLKIIYLIITVVGAWLIFFLPLSLIARSVLMLIYVFIIAFIFQKLAADKAKSYVKIFDEQCLVTPFLNEYKRISEHRGPKQIRNMALLNVVTGYINLGKYDKAYHTLGTIQINDKATDKNTILIKATKENDLFVYYWHIKQWDDAEQHLAQFDHLLRDDHFPEKSKAAYEAILDYNKKAYLSNRGSADYLDDFQDYFDHATTLRSKVNSAANLANIYRNLNNREEEIRYLEFVKENGNELVVKKEAVERLKILEEKNEG